MLPSWLLKLLKRKVRIFLIILLTVCNCTKIPSIEINILMRRFRLSMILRQGRKVQLLLGEPTTIPRHYCSISKILLSQNKNNSMMNRVKKKIMIHLKLNNKISVKLKNNSYKKYTVSRSNKNTIFFFNTTKQSL